MKLPSMTSPGGLFDYIVLFILASAAFFGAIFAALYFGVI